MAYLIHFRLFTDSLPLVVTYGAQGSHTGMLIIDASRERSRKSNKIFHYDWVTHCDANQWTRLIETNQHNKLLIFEI